MVEQILLLIDFERTVYLIQILNASDIEEESEGSEDSLDFDLGI